MSTPSSKELPAGTTPYFANMHKWLQRGLFVCLAALVIEGALSAPLMALWYGWPQLSFKDICSELQKVRYADDTRECVFPYPLFAPSEGAGQKTAQDDWGVQPKPKYKAIGYRELIRIREARLAREAAARQRDDASASDARRP
jgi:hypothetical protein